MDDTHARQDAGPAAALSPDPSSQPHEDAKNAPPGAVCLTRIDSQALPPQSAAHAPLACNGKAGDSPDGNKLFVWFFLGLLVFSLFLLYTMFRPFLDSIILACVFTAISHPFYTRCLKITRGRKALAAAIVLLVMLFLVILPICVFISGLIPQAVKSVAAINEWLATAHISDTINEHLAPVISWLREQFPQLDLATIDVRSSIIEASRNAGRTLISMGTYILANTLSFFAHLLLIMLIMFFLLMDGATLVKRLAYLAPLKPEQTAVIVESMRRMARAVLVGGFCVAALQGLTGGIGLAIVGVPALFWGTVMAFAAFVPVIGTGLVWVPAVGYLFLAGRWKSAVFLLIWCGVGVTAIDSFLRPLLMREGAKVSVLFIFLAILGGVNVFGMLGLLYGPMILGLVAVMLTIYSEEYQSILVTRSNGFGDSDDNSKA